MQMQFDSQETLRASALVILITIKIAAITLELMTSTLLRKGGLNRIGSKPLHIKKSVISTALDQGWLQFVNVTVRLYWNRFCSTSIFHSIFLLFKYQYFFISHVRLHFLYLFSQSFPLLHLIYFWTILMLKYQLRLS